MFQFITRASLFCFTIQRLHFILYFITVKISIGHFCILREFRYFERLSNVNHIERLNVDILKKRYVIPHLNARYFVILVQFASFVLTCRCTSINQSLHVNLDCDSWLFFVCYPEPPEPVLLLDSLAHADLKLCRCAISTNQSINSRVCTVISAN